MEMQHKSTNNATTVSGTKVPLRRNARYVGISYEVFQKS
jgi:hypothetical protein